MSFKHILAGGLLSVRNMVIYAFVLLYILVYILGVAGVLPPFEGKFTAPAVLLLYGLLASLIEAAAIRPSEEAEEEGYGNYRVVKNAATDELTVTLAEVAPGDSVILSKGDYIPFSGDVISGRAYVNEDGTVAEKSPASGRNPAASHTLKAGSTVYAGNIIVEVSENETKHPKKRRNLSEFIKNFHKNRTLFWWVKCSAILLSLVMVTIRFIKGYMWEFGTAEVALDNIALAFCLVLLSAPFYKGDSFFTAAYAKISRLRVKDGLRMEEFGTVNNLAVDAKLLFPAADPVFCAVMADNEERELQNISDIKKVPEPIKSLLLQNIKIITEHRFGLADTTDDAVALRRFAGLTENDLDGNSEMLTEIPYTPDERIAAATVRRNGVIATEYYGKPNFIEGASVFYDDGDRSGRKTLDGQNSDRLQSLFTVLANEGKRVRLAAVNRTAIKGGVLPADGWLILGYFVFPAAPTFAVKKAVNAAADSGLNLSLIRDYESLTYNEYLKRTLRISGTNENEAALGKSASVVMDVTALAARSDLIITSKAADAGIKLAADIVTDTDTADESFTAAVKVLERCRKLSGFIKVFAVLTGLLVLASFFIYSFALYSLPVIIADSTVPAMLGIALLTAVVEIFTLRSI